MSGNLDLDCKKYQQQPPLSDSEMCFFKFVSGVLFLDMTKDQHPWKAHLLSTWRRGLEVDLLYRGRYCLVVHMIRCTCTRFISRPVVNWYSFVVGPLSPGKEDLEKYFNTRSREKYFNTRVRWKYFNTRRILCAPSITSPLPNIIDVTNVTTGGLSRGAF